MQNITRGTHKIRIRWLSQVDPKDVKTKSKGHSSRDADEVLNFNASIYRNEDNVIFLSSRIKMKADLMSTHLTSTTTRILSAFLPI